MAKQEAELKAEAKAKKEAEEEAGIAAEGQAKQEAIEKAESYLAYTAFSKSSLIEQLEYEGFSNEDATHAVNQMGL